MNIELNEEGYTLDGKWKLVPVECTQEMIEKLPRGKIGKTVTIGSKYNELVLVSPKPSLKYEVILDNGHMKITGMHLEEIQMDSDILPEFKHKSVGYSISGNLGKINKIEFIGWCKHCGQDKRDPHLTSCPTLKSKL